MPIYSNIDSFTKELMIDLTKVSKDAIEANMIGNAGDFLKDVVNQSAKFKYTGYYWASHDIGIGKPSKYQPRSAWMKVSWFDLGTSETVTVRRRLKERIGSYSDIKTREVRHIYANKNMNYRDPIKRGMKTLEKYKAGIMGEKNQPIFVGTRAPHSWWIEHGVYNVKAKRKLPGKFIYHNAGLRAETRVGKY